METLIIALPVLIFSVVVHEYAHGWVALQQGDHTAQMLGRLTLNPVPHIDPVGSLLVPALLVLMPGNAILGWAKPVPVNPRNFREYKKGDILVSLAGVAANALLVIACIFLLAAAIWLTRLVPGPEMVWTVIREMAMFGIWINVILIVFNLLPIPPLDGSHIVYHLLPPELAVRYRAIGQYGILILLVLLFMGGFRFLLAPVVVLVGIAQAAVGLLI